MRIAQVSPLYEAVPPKLYGGTERIVSYLTEELIRQNHQVTLFASADSQTKAELISPCASALRLSQEYRDPLIYHTIMLDMVLDMQEQFDIIHFHIDYHHFLMTRQLKTPHVTTLHGRMDLPDYPCLYQKFNNIPLVSISRSQKSALPEGHWIDTVYHGLPPAMLPFRNKKENYLAFLGRMSPEKNPQGAILMAAKAGMKIKIAAKIDGPDKDFYEKTVRPLLQSPHVEFLGEISDKEKPAFLGEARALLFPITWPEPFGLVMIEALSCGTPVIAYNYGSVPEIIDHDKTGFIVSSIEEGAQVLQKLHELEPSVCRQVFEERFVDKIMAGHYLQVYQNLISCHRERAVL